MGWFEDQAAELGIDPSLLNTAPEVARTTGGTPPQVSQQQGGPQMSPQDFFRGPS